mmetsp:Transcript_42166/g.116556  ORF Transcript_42166/g.116556 Transcript_42166/m.116556 type:complete len:152 (-) Transcript_42166:223-678(-)
MQAEVASDSELASRGQKGEGRIHDGTQIGSQLHEARRASPRRPPRAPRHCRGTHRQGSARTVDGALPVAARAALAARAHAVAALASLTARTRTAAAPVSLVARACAIAALASATARMGSHIAAALVPLTIRTRAAEAAPAEDATISSGGSG